MARNGPALHLRITDDDAARLVKLAERLPFGTKHGLAYSALQAGLALLERSPDLSAALVQLEKGPTKATETAKPREAPPSDDWVAREIEVKRARVEARKKREG